jgi:hypothetical protein
MNEMVQFKVALYKHLHAHNLYTNYALNDSQLKERILFLHVKIVVIIQ